MSKKITVQEFRLGKLDSDKPRVNIIPHEWDDEPFVPDSGERTIRVISISFNGRSNQVKQIHVKAFTYEKP